MTARTATEAAPHEQDPVRHAAAQVRVALDDALARLDPRTRRLCRYHLGFADRGGHPIDATAAGGAGGKGVRSTLAVLSAQAAGGSLAAAIPAAVAVELVHNFSLVHDDVMDNDTTRRYRPTVWSVYGRSEAILAGDALLTLASEILAESGIGGATWAIRCVNAATRRLVGGQMADLAFETCADVSLDECVAMAQDKTGALLSCAASVGAVLCGGPADLALGLADYGDHLGLAFQLRDDLLGIWGDPAVTGKSARSDLRAGKKSLPVVAALTSGTAAGDRLAEHYAAEQHAAPSTEAAAAQHAQRPDHELDELAGLIEQAGGRQWAEDAARRELDAALTALHALDAPAGVVDRLEDLAVRLGGRDR